MTARNEICYQKSTLWSFYTVQQFFIKMKGKVRMVCSNIIKSGIKIYSFSPLLHCSFKNDLTKNKLFLSTSVFPIVAAR